jgi:hypothetical protein
MHVIETAVDFVVLITVVIWEWRGLKMLSLDGCGGRRLKFGILDWSGIRG